MVPVIIIAAIVLFIILYNLPSAKKKRALKAEELKAKEAAADTLIETSDFANRIADYFVNYLSDTNGDAIEYLRQRQTFFRLPVTRTGLILEKDCDNMSSKLYNDLHYDEKNRMLPPEARGIAYLSFREADYDNLPNDQMAEALHRFLISKIAEIPFITIKKDYNGDDKIYYTPQKGSW